MPPILFLFTVFIECGMYMKAGNKIRKNASGYEVEHKISKQMLQNTDWFYGDTNEQSEKEQIQDQKRRDKLEKELSEWKELLESGEIDEETYQQETSQLIEKEKRRSERKKK